MCYARQGDLGAAAAELEGLLGSDPGFARARLALGQVREGQGNTAAALRAYQELVDSGPGGSRLVQEARSRLTQLGSR